MNATFLILSVTLLAIILIATAAVKNNRKPAEAQMKSAPITAEPDKTKQLRNFLGVITFIIFVAYFFLHVSYLLYIGIGLVILVDILGTVSKVSRAAKKTNQSQPAVNEQPDLAGMQFPMKSADPGIYPKMDQLPKTAARPADLFSYPNLTQTQKPATRPSDQFSYPQINIPKPVNNDPSQYQSIDYFDNSGTWKKITIFIIGIVIVLGVAAAVLYSIGMLSQFLGQF
jgi:hypothetical protein